MATQRLVGEDGLASFFLVTACHDDTGGLSAAMTAMSSNRFDQELEHVLMLS